MGCGFWPSLQASGTISSRASQLQTLLDCGANDMDVEGCEVLHHAAANRAEGEAFAMGQQERLGVGSRVE